MARTRLVGDQVLRVNDQGYPVPGLVSATTGIPSATGCTVNVFDYRSPADHARPSSVQNTDGVTQTSWDFVAWSGLKLLRDADIAAATSGTSNKPAGKFILSSSGTAFTLTNSLITSTSIVYGRDETSGDTVTLLSIVPTAGQAVFTFSGAVAADTTVSWTVFNGN